MDIEKFIAKQQHAVKRYRIFYRSINILICFFILYTILHILNIDAYILSLKRFELYSDLEFNIAIITLKAANVALLVLVLPLSTLMGLLLSRSKTGNMVLLIEEKYPSLKERLRTAYDNRKEHNLLVDELMTGVLATASKVNPSSFIEKRKLKIGLLLLVISISSFSYVTMENYRSDITPDDISDLVDSLPLTPDKENTTSPDELFALEEDGDDDTDQAGGEENLMGEPTIVVVEGEEVDLSMPPGAGIGFTDSGDEDKTPPEFESSSAYDVGQMSSPAYYEQLPEGYESIIKEYFEQMAQE